MAAQFFVCTYGNFETKDDLLIRSFGESCYFLHRTARYPEALNQIRSGDFILLKDGPWIIAWGIASGSVEYCPEEEGWDYVVRVEEWHRFREKEHSYGIAEGTLVGGQFAVVKLVKEDWALEKMKDGSEETRLEEQIEDRFSAEETGERKWSN